MPSLPSPAPFLSSPSPPPLARAPCASRPSSMWLSYIDIVMIPVEGFKHGATSACCQVFFQFIFQLAGDRLVLGGQGDRVGGVGEVVVVLHELADVVGDVAPVLFVLRQHQPSQPEGMGLMGGIAHSGNSLIFLNFARKLLTSIHTTICNFASFAQAPEKVSLVVDKPSSELLSTAIGEP